MRRNLYLLACVTLACAPGDSDVDSHANDTLPVAMNDSADVRDGQAMPLIPDAQAGQLALVTATVEEQYKVDGAWEVWGGRCEESGLLQLIARGSGVGTAVMLSLPDTGSAVGGYRVAEGDRGKPDPYTARVVLQVYGEDRAYVLRGLSGEVRLDSLLTTASGELTAVLAERTFRDTVRAAAAFMTIPVPLLGPAECQLLEEDAGGLGTPR